MQRNQRASGENNSRTMGYARRFLARDREQSRNETLFSTPGFRRPENVEVSSAIELTSARVSACSARRYNANAANLSSFGAPSAAAVSTDAHGVVDVSCGENAAQSSSQEALVESIEELERQMEQSCNTESKKSLKYCTLFTAVAKSSGLPVLKIERARPTNKDEMVHSGAFNVDHDDYKTDDEIPPLRLIMRIGRSLRSTYKQRNQSITQQVAYDEADDVSDWWSSRFSEHLRAESAARTNRANIDATHGVLFLYLVYSVIYFKTNKKKTQIVSGRIKVLNI